MTNTFISSTANKNFDEQVFIGSDWVPSSFAKVSVFDHAILYGDGVYEGLRAYGGVVFKEREHLLRLERSARCIGLCLPYSVKQISNLIQDGLKLNELNDAYIRIVVTRGEGPIGPDPAPCTDPQFILIVRSTPPLHSNHGNGIRLALSTVRRCAIDSATAQIKSLNYLTAVLGKLEANRLDVDDVLMMDHRGFIAEAPVANVFIVRNEQVLTPPPFAGILEGITRQTIIEILDKNKVNVREVDITPYDLLVSDEIFLTGTHAEIVAAAEYNGLLLKGNKGKIVQLAKSEFSDLTKNV
ncbi:MAG: aminotransferase class IV [Candidatus Halichondribacter symbioticus]